LDTSPGYTLDFSNTASRHADILIGADGAWSRVRPLLTPVLPLYTSITFFDLVISDIDTRFPHIGSLVGKGMAFIVSDNKAIIPQRNSNGSVRIYLGLRVPEEWADDHPLPSDPVKARQFLVSLVEDWSPSLLEIITSVDDAPMITRKIFAVPPSFTWTTALRGITLVGDAAHVMSPFAGEGVNLALFDAYRLGKELVDSLSKGFTGEERAVKVDEGIRRYEAGMWAMAQEKAEESASNLDALFAMDAPRAFVEVVKSYGPPIDAE
jgi:2-polyprenyl-6-methoxyphenol hydroxylase-like FAD-dependent oxidoreductase